MSISKQVLRFILLSLISTSVLLLSSCKTTKVRSDELIPADVLYNDGIEKARAGKFKDAAEKFSEVYFQHPGSELTPKAELMEAYSLYKARIYDEAEDVADNFIKLHPMHPKIGDAYYLKALSLYTRVPNIYLTQDVTENALNTFKEMTLLFPNTKYSRFANTYGIIVEDRLAAYEVYIGTYYLKNRKIVSAINRFKKVQTLYPHTRHMPEALFRLAESFHALGLKKETQHYLTQLHNNYKDSVWANSQLDKHK